MAEDTMDQDAWSGEWTQTFNAVPTRRLGFSRSCDRGVAAPREVRRYRFTASITAEVT
jgi:hypothetical protein